ncbi:MAG: HsdM family class I SAM-dependent methyltransferase, partial [Phycisphaerae bacterium]
MDKSNQLDFVDAGFLPLLREEAGKKLHDLVEAMTRATLKGLGQGNPSRAMIRDVFTAVFRMLAGKILKDKGVPGFKTLDLTDPGRVLAAVARHYSDGQTAAPLNGRWPTALISAAAQLIRASSFGVVSPETLAYVYEHTLVTPLLRKKMGIHATPPWLVDYIVWQLYNWIREIPTEGRHVFEPGCGHAPFLLSAMRLLRMEMQDQADMEIHAYLREHLHGAEIDDFAREIARLSLTLADIPHPNGWDLNPGDMFASDVLMREAAKCRILLSNPPYESFDLDGKRRCESAGLPVTHKKAVELLHRTLNKLPPGGIFGVVVPQSVVNGPEAKTLREELLANFEIAEVCLFPGKVFEFAEIETAI